VEPNHPFTRESSSPLMKISTMEPGQFVCAMGMYSPFETIRGRTGEPSCSILTYPVSDGKAYCVDHAIADLELQAKLDPKKFFHIHRSTVVNLAWTKEVASLPGGMLSIRLKDTERTDLTVARDRAREFKMPVVGDSSKSEFVMLRA
jgi:hypothetical protein